MGTTRYRLAEQAQRILAGGNVGSALKYHIRELIISVCQVANQLLKIEYMQTNIPMGEMIPAGASIGTYDTGIFAYKYKNTSAITLPTAPMRLPRDIGCYAVYPLDDPYAEFIPLQMGQAGLIQSQGLLSNLAGGIGYERFGLIVQFTKDITIPNQQVPIGVRLVVLDFNLYDDYTPLPLSADQEWAIVQEVVKTYSQEPVPDKLMDPGGKNQQVPIKDQMQA